MSFVGKTPYVCNGCSKRYSCSLIKQYYDAKFAQKEYEFLLKDSRTGIVISKESFYEMDSTIYQQVKKGQHLYHILKTCNLPVSLSTVYRLLDKGYLSISPLDLPRKVKFKPRKVKSKVSIPKSVRIGRTYEDFNTFLNEHNISNWVEMDTVIGKFGGKAILTWNFTFCNFMVGFLLDSNTSFEVSRVFLNLKKLFEEKGLRFGDILPVILTDNGSEFSNVNIIECDFEASVVNFHN